MPTETSDHQDCPHYIAEPQPTPETAPDLWRLRDLVLLMVFVPVDLVISNLLAFMGYAALKPVVGWQATPHSLQNNPLFLLSLQSIFYVFLFAYIYLLVVVRYQAPFWRSLKWRPLTTSQTLRFFLAGMVLSLLVMFAPSFLPEQKSFPLEKMFSSPAAAYAIAGFAVLVAPFMEELLFRGVLFAFIERHGGLKFAVLATAALFAGLHVPEYWGAWNHVLLILIVGIVFSLARGLTDSLTPSVILHFAYNASLMMALYLQTNHFRTIPGVLGF